MDRGMAKLHTSIMIAVRLLRRSHLGRALGNSHTVPLCLVISNIVGYFPSSIAAV
jgi:hypothetical protein